MKRTIKLIETTKGHFYEIGDPELNESVYLPSSTNILSVFPNPGLDIWFQSTSPEEIKRKQDEGKISGSKVHHCIATQLMGEKVSINGLTDEQINALGLTEKKLISYLKEPLTDREEEALKGAENFWEEFKPIVVGSELMVYSLKVGFAGTMDFIGYLYDKKTKKYDLWIIDYKISKSIDRSYDLQVASYWKAFEETYKKNIKQVRLGILQLGKNKCNYSFKEVKDKKRAWELFIETKDIYDDLFPNNKPIEKERQPLFVLPEFHKKGKLLNLNQKKHESNKRRIAKKDSNSGEGEPRIS